MEPVAVLSGIIALAAIYIGVLYLLSWSRVDAGSGASADAVRNAEDAIDRDAGVVRCPHCGTENELGYRYCAGCIGELPGAVSTTSTGMQPSQRGIL